mgnify:CR=1 FL=1
MPISDAALLENLFDRIRDARERSGLSVDDAAKSLGVSRVQIWRLEHKSKTITAERLFEIADLYGVDPRSLFEGSDAPVISDELYRRIGEVVVMVEQQAQELGAKPPPQLISDAVIEILRQETKNQPIPDATPMDASKYQGLIALLFKQATKP